MSKGQEPCEPLDWQEQFLPLLLSISGEIEQQQSSELSETLRRYQTIIACGGYLGLRAKEFLDLSWHEIIGKTHKMQFQFKPKTKRKVYFSPSLLKIVERNYLAINPDAIHHLILHKKGEPLTPISTTQFNLYFKRRMKKAGLFKGNEEFAVASHTLRKTYVNFMFHSLGGDHNALVQTAKHMNYRSPDQVLDYLGIDKKNVKDFIFRMP